MMPLHSDPIAQNGATCVWTARINCENPYGLTFGTQCNGELIAQSALARAGSSGNAQHKGPSGVGKKPAEERLRFVASIFNPCCGACESALIASPNLICRLTRGQAAIMTSQLISA